MEWGADHKAPLYLHISNQNTPTQKVVRWQDTLQPYLKNRAIYHCPSATDREYPEAAYGYNYSRTEKTVQLKLTGSKSTAIDLLSGERVDLNRIVLLSLEPRLLQAEPQM